MTYIRFLFKQVLKNKLSYIPLVLILICCLGTLFLNQRTQTKLSPVVLLEESLVETRNFYEEAKAKLEKANPSDQNYEHFQESFALQEELLAFRESLLEAWKTKRWDKVYEMTVTDLQRLSDSFDHLPESLRQEDMLQREVLKYESLEEVGLPYEDDHLPSVSTQFILSLFRYILPALLPVGLAYVLTNLYGSAYEGKLDKNRLLPQSLISITGKNILVGSLYSLLSLLAVLGPVALISGLLYGWGNLNYPILFYSLTTKEMMFSAVGQVILPTIFLHALSLVFMTVLIYLITILTKNKMTALFISTIVLLSGIALPGVLAPVSAVAHLIPTTYVRSFDIMTGVFQHSIENYQVNTGLGIGVLILSTLGLSLLCLLAQKPKNNLRITA